MRKRAPGWTGRAAILRAAKLLINGDAHAEALFHCQQAAEKALKAFLTFHQRPFPKTHELGELTPDCLAIDSSLASSVLEAEALTQYAWRFRYPGVPYDPEAAEAIDARQKADAVLREIEQRLSLEHREGC